MVASSKKSGSRKPIKRGGGVNFASLLLSVASLFLSLIVALLFFGYIFFGDEFLDYLGRDGLVQFSDLEHEHDTDIEGVRLSLDEHVNDLHAELDILRGEFADVGSSIARVESEGFDSARRLDLQIDGLYRRISQFESRLAEAEENSRRTEASPIEQLSLSLVNLSVLLDRRIERGDDLGELLQFLYDLSVGDEYLRGLYIELRDYQSLGIASDSELLREYDSVRLGLLRLLRGGDAGGGFLSDIEHRISQSIIISRKGASDVGLGSELRLEQAMRDKDFAGAHEIVGDLGVGSLAIESWIGSLSRRVLFSGLVIELGNYAGQVIARTDGGG